MVTQNFIKLVQTGAGANSTTQINLEVIKQLYETNFFNVLTLLNSSTTTPIILILDGQEVAYIPQNNGVFEIKPEYFYKYSFIAIKNDTANILTTELKLILGVVGEVA